MPVFEANGVRTAYRTIGSGPPLLLLHGLEADANSFDRLVPGLAKTFTVITYDQRDSGATVNSTEPYNLRDLAADAAALIEGLGYQRTHVYGTSFGGLVAQVLACEHPQLVDRLVLGSTFPVGTSLQDANPSGVATLAGLRSGGVDALASLAELYLTPEFVRDTPDAAAEFQWLTPTNTDERRARRWAVTQAPITIDASRICAPTLILIGADDRLVPPEITQALAAEIPCAAVRTFDGVGHVATFQAPQRVMEALIGFLLPLGVAEISHISLCVASVESSRPFYEGVLGLTPVPRPTLRMAGAWYRVGDLQLHLMVPPDAREIPTREPLTEGPVVAHVAFAVPDMAGAVRKLHETGTPVVLGASGIDQVFVLDPSGNVIELIAAS